MAWARSSPATSLRIATAPPGKESLVGVRTKEVAAGRPACPRMLAPQAYTSPASVRIKVCLSPAAICAAKGIPVINRGALVPLRVK